MTFMVSWWTVTALAMAAGPLSSVPPDTLDWEPSENRRQSLAGRIKYQLKGGKLIWQVFQKQIIEWLNFNQLIDLLNRATEMLDRKLPPLIMAYEQMMSFNIKNKQIGSRILIFTFSTV